MPVASSNATQMYGVVSASKIIGEAVINRQNESLGKIHNCDRRWGRSPGLRGPLFGGLWVWEKLFAMPEAFEFSTAENKLIPNVVKEKPGRPGFDQDKWPDFAIDGAAASTATTATTPLNM